MTKNKRRWTNWFARAAKRKDEIRRRKQRNAVRPMLETLEDRRLLATVSDSGTTTLTIMLAANEDLALVSNGASYTFSSDMNFTDDGVADTGDFSAFGSTSLTLDDLTQYDTINIVDGAGNANATVTFNNSGANNYGDAINVTLDDVSAGQITFNGTTAFAGSAALSASTTGNIILSSGANIATVNGGVTLSAGGSVNLAASINTDGGNVSFTSGNVILTSSVTIDTESGNDNPAGNVDFTGTTRIEANAKGRDLAIDTSTGSGAGGAVTLVEISGTGVNRPNDLNVDSRGSTNDGVITIGGAINLNDDGAGNAATATFAGDVRINASRSISTSDGTANGGAIDLQEATVSATGAGFNLILNTSNTGGTTENDITLGTFNSAGGSMVNNLTANAGTSGDITSASTVTLSGTLSATAAAINVDAVISAASGISFNNPTTTMLDAGLQTDGGNIAISGGNVVLKSSVSIDTESGDDNAAGSVNFTGVTLIEANGKGRDLIIDTSTGSGAGGAVTLVEISGTGVNRPNDLNVDSRGSTTDGVITIGGAINLNDDGAGIAATATFAGDVRINASRSISTSDGTANGGAIDLQEATVSATGAGFNLILNTSNTGGTTENDITLGTFNSAGGSAVNNLTTNAGTTGDVDFRGAVAIGGNLDADAFSIALSTSSSDISINGSGIASLTTTRNITLNSGSSITTANGGITLSANQQGTPTTGSAFIGVSLDNADLKSTNGTIVVQGKGGDTSSNSHGVRLSSGSTIDTDGNNATIMITGQSTHDDAVLITGGSSVTTGGTGSGDGADITIMGTHSGTAANGQGVTVSTGSVTTSGNMADVNLTGASGTTRGIQLFNTMAKTTGDTAIVKLDGTANGSVSTLSKGVVLQGTTVVSTTGTNSTVDIDGAATNASGEVGVSLETGVQVSTTQSNAGITIDGTTANNSDDAIAIGGATVGGGSTTGPITITADSIRLSSGTNILDSSGDLVIQPKTTGTAINLGTGATNSGLQLDDMEIGRLADGFNSITIGDATNGTGAVDVNASTFNDPVTIVGGSVDVTGLAAGSNAVTLTARTGNITDGGGTTDVTGGTVTLNAEKGTIGQSTGNGAIELAATTLITDSTDGTNNGNQYLSETDSVNWNMSTAGMGTIALDGGTFIVQSGQTITGNVDVNSGATLAGVGDIDGLVSVASGGATAPGTSPGILDYNAGLTIASGGTLDIELATVASGNTAGTHYAQANVSGGTSPNVNISGATLTLSGTSASPASGEQLLIVNNDGTDAVNGTFSGLGDGSTITHDGDTWYISYYGGDGNDVTLTAAYTGAATVSVDGAAEVRRIGNTIQVVDGGTVVFSAPLAAVQTNGLTVNGGSNADTLTVNYVDDATTDGFFDVDITFNGNNPTSGTGDELIVVGGTFTDVVLNHATASSGDVTLDTTTVISYTGLEPVTVGVGGTNLTVNLNNSVNLTDLSIIDAANPPDTDALVDDLFIDSTNGTHEDDTVLDILGYSTITVNASGGNDVITLDTTLSAFTGLAGRTLVVNGDANDDNTIVESGVTLTGNANHSTALDLQGGTLALANNAQFDSLQDSSGTGTVNLGAFTLTVGDATNTTFDGTINGSGGLTKVGAGSLTLNGANGYGGLTDIDAGTVVLGNASALGTTAGGTDVASGAVLDLNGQTVGGEAVVVVGTGIGGTGALINSSASAASLAGTVNMAAGGNAWTTGGTGNITLTGGVEGTLTKISNNTLTLGGTGDNPGLRVNANGGTVELNKASTATVHAVGGGGLFIDNGALVTLTGTGTDQIYDDGDLTVTNGTFDLNGRSEAVDAFNGGTSGIVDNTVAATTATLTVGSFGSGGTFSGIIRNTDGTTALTKTGSGLITLSGNAANTYTGLTTVDNGRLHLNKSSGNAVGGNLTLSTGGDLTFGANHQIANAADVNVSGAGSVFNGTGVNAGARSSHVETIGSLTLTGGAFNTGSSSQWTVTNAGSFTGGAGNTIFVGNSASRLSFGSLSLTAMTATAGGTPDTNNSFTLYGNDTSTQSSITVGSGGLMLENSVLNLRRGGTGANGSKLVLDGNVTSSGTMPTAVTEDTNGGVNGAIAVELSSTTAAVTRTFSVAGGGADLTIDIPITNGASSAGSLTKTGMGTLILEGASTYSGTTMIDAGTILANNTTGSATGTNAVEVNNTATLAGTGSITGPVNVNNGGTLSPGDPTVTDTTDDIATGSLDFDATSTFTVEIGGTSAGAFDQVDVTGTVDVGGAILSLSLVDGFTPSTTTLQSFAIINNDGTDPVVGTFNGLPEGSPVSVGGSTMYISYAGDGSGGSGNDVVLHSQPVVNGGAGVDTVVLRRNAGNTEFEFSLNGGAFVGIGNPTAFYFNGAGGNDVMTVDFVNGDPIPGNVGGAGEGVFFNGETHTSINPGDMLRILATSSETITSLPDGTANATDNDGILNVTGQGTISYSRIEPMDVVGAGSFTLTTANSADLITIANGTEFGGAMNPAMRVSGTSDGVPFETHALRNVGTVIIDTATNDAVSPDDVVTITSAHNAHGNGNLTISTGNGSDRVELNGNVSIDGNFTLTGVENMLVGATATIDTEQGDDNNGGNITMGGASISADVAGRDLTLNTSVGAGDFNGGAVSLGQVGSGPAFINDFLLNTAGSGTGAPGSITLNATVVMDDNGTGDAGSFTVQGGGNIIVTTSMLIETEIGNTAGVTDVGVIDLGTSSISGSGNGFDLTLDTSNSGTGSNAGNINIGPINNDGGGFINDITIHAGGNNNSGDVTFNGAVQNATVGGDTGHLQISNSDDVLQNSGASILTTGPISAIAQNAITLNDSVNATTDTIQFHANQDEAGAQSFTMNAGSSITTTNTGSSAIIISVNDTDGGTGNALLTSLQTGNGGRVRVAVDDGTDDADGGAIIDNNGGLTNITASEAVLTAALGVGTDADAIETAVAAGGSQLTITSTTGAGDNRLTHTGNLVIGNVGGANGVRINDTGNDNSAMDNITVVATGSLTVNNVVDNRDGGNISLTSMGGAATNDLTINANVSITGGDNASDGDGNITLNAGSDILQNAGGDVTADGAGAVDYNAGTATAYGVITMADGTLASSDTGLMTMDADGDITVSRVVTGNNTTAAVAINTTGGAVIDAGDTGGVDIQATAGRLVIDASQGVGSDGEFGALETNVSSLDIDNTQGTPAGNINILESNAVTVVNVDQDATDGTVRLQTVNGLIDVQGTIDTFDGDITLLAGGGNNGDISLSAAITTTTSAAAGNIFLKADDDVTLNAAGDITAGDTASVFIQADLDGDDDGSIQMLDGALINAVTGTIDLHATDDIRLGGLRTTGDVYVTTLGGAIIDGGSTHREIQAETATLRADTGIGSGGALETAVDTLAASNASSGGIEIINTNDSGVAAHLSGTLTVGSGADVNEFVASDRTLTLLSTGANAVDSTTFDNLDVNGSTFADGDDITITGLNAAGGAVNTSFLNVDIDVTTLGDLLTAITAAFGDATATLDNGVIVLTANLPGDNSLSLNLTSASGNTGNMNSDPLGNFVTCRHGLTTLHGVANIAGLVDLTETMGDVTISNTPAANDIFATSTIDVTLEGDDKKLTLNSMADSESTGGTHTYTADKMDIQGTITGTGQRVILQPNETGELIDLGSTVDTTMNTLELSDAELDRITAEVLEIGRNDSGNEAGDITITDTIDAPPGWDTLNLETGAGVVDGHADMANDLVVTNLAIESVTGVGSADDLETSVSNLAIINSNNGDPNDINIDNNDPVDGGNSAAGAPLTITTVDGIVGILNDDGTGSFGSLLRIRNHGLMTILEDVEDLTGTSGNPGPGTVSRGEVRLTANETTGGANDDMNIQIGVEVTSANGPVLLNVGDNLTIQSGVIVTGGTTVIINADNGNSELDPDNDAAGSNVTIVGTVNVGTMPGDANGDPTAFIETGDDVDTISIVPSLTSVIAGNASREETVGAQFHVYADAPAVPNLPDDTLFVNLTGVLDPVNLQTPHPSLPQTGLPNELGSGTWTFGNRQSIEYAAIQTVLHTTYQPQIIDNDDAGWSMPGIGMNFLAHSDYYLNDVRYAAGGGNGSTIGQWQFTGLQPGERYRVSATWGEHPNRATNAPYTIFGGETSQTVAINQQLPPSSYDNAFQDDGVFWADLSPAYGLTATGTTLTVQLTDLANGVVIADAVRIERFIVEPEIAVEDTTGSMSLTDETSTVNFGSHAYNDVFPERTFTIENTGSGDLELGTVLVPPEYVLVSGPAKTTLITGDSTTFVVALQTTTPGTHSGQITIDTNDKDEDPFNFLVTGMITGTSGKVIIDNAVPTVRVPADPGLPQQGTFTVGGVGSTDGTENLNGNSFGTLVNSVFGYVSGSAFYFGDDANGGDAHFAEPWVADSGQEGGATASVIDIAQWQFTGLTAGTYRVSATWGENTNRATDAPFNIFNGNGPNRSAYLSGTTPIDPTAATGYLATVDVNQKLSPAASANSFVDEGVEWSDLGYFTITGDKLTVQLTNVADGTVIADAIRIEPVTGPEISVQNTTDSAAVNDGQTTVDFGTTNQGADVTKTFTVTNVGAADLTLGVLTGPGSGFTTTYMPQTVMPGNTYSFSITLDANNVGSFSGEFSIVTNDNDENPFNFDLTGVVGGPTVQIIDDTEPTVSPGTQGFAITSGKSNFSYLANSAASIYHLADTHYAAAGVGNRGVEWTFTGLTNGATYRVSATWTAHSNRATNAPYTITDGTTPESVTVNQRVNPDDFTDEGTLWEDLGLYTIGSGTTLTVRTTDNANGVVIADAVRIERIAAPEITIDQGGTNLVDGQSVVNFGAVLQNSGSPSKTFTITNDGTASLTLGSITLPPGYSSTYTPTTLAPNATANFTITLSTAIADLFTGDVSIANNDPDENPFNFTVSATVGNRLIIDNDDAGFSESSGSFSFLGGSGASAYFDSDVRFQSAGNGSNEVEWQFDNLVDGEMYEVAVTWQPHANRATNAPFAVVSGSNSLTPAGGINQQAAPDDFNTDGFNWESLGTITADGTSLTVGLSDNANGVVIADAVRVSRVFPAGNNEIEVTLDPTGSMIDVPDDIGQINFGTAFLGGTAVSRTIRIENVGTAPLELIGPIEIPAGFSQAGYSPQVLAASSFIDVTLTLATSTAGTFGGEVRFANDDMNENPFNFNISGTVARSKIVDDNDHGFSTSSGSFQYLAGTSAAEYFANDTHFQTSGSGSNEVQFEFTDLSPGPFRVAATWTANANRATNVPYTFFSVNSSGAETPLTPTLESMTDPDKSLSGNTLRLNQQQVPNDLVEQGANWESLARVTIPAGGVALRVRVSDDANGVTIADALRLEPAPNAPEIQIEQVDVSTGVVLGEVADGQATAIDFGSTTMGGSNITKRFRVTNAGLANLSISGSPSVTGFTTTFSNQSIAPGATYTFDISLDASAAIGTKMGTFSFTTDDSDEDPFDFPISGLVGAAAKIIDNNPTPFSEPDGTFDFAAGSWLYYSNASAQSLYGYFENDTHYRPAGSGNNIAEWTFSGLTPGVYQVAATWGPHGNRATNAPFTIQGNAGGDLTTTVQVNQKSSPASFPGSFNDQGVPWAILSSGYTLNAGGNEISIRLSDNANGFVMADAIRLVQVSTLLADSFPTAEHSSSVGDAPVPILTTAELNTAAEAAVNRWLEQPVTQTQASMLRSITFHIADLPGAVLGGATAQTVAIDIDAAGWGWLIDATPTVDEEFTPVAGSSQLVAGAGSDASSRMDLVTTIYHELGHVIGFQDVDPQDYPGALMSVTLPAGTRRLPESVSNDHDSLSLASVFEQYATLFAGTAPALPIGANASTVEHNPLDVNFDGFVSALDVLYVVNAINSNPTGEVEPAELLNGYGIDTNGNGLLSAQDALLIINYLNGLGAVGEGEGKTSGNTLPDTASLAQEISQDDVEIRESSDAAIGWQALNRRTGFRNDGSSTSIRANHHQYDKRQDTTAAAATDLVFGRTEFRSADDLHSVADDLAHALEPENADRGEEIFAKVLEQFDW